MAIGRTAFKRIQLGVEVTPGTAVPATEVFYGTVDAPHVDITMHEPEQDRNLLSMHKSDDFIVQKEIEITLEGELNTRHIVWQLINSIAGNITPTQPDATNEPLAYLWNIIPSLTGTGNTPDETNGIDAMTIEYGDNLQGYEAEYAFTKTIEVSGSPGEAVMVTSTIAARQITATTFTGSLVDQSVQYFPANTVKLYIDPSYANLGSTQVLDLLSEWTWTLETNFTGRFTAEGNLYFTGINEAAKNVELQMTFLESTASETEKVKYNARTNAFIRIECNAPVEIDAAQSNTPYVQFDGAYRYSEWDAPSDDEGSQTIQVTAKSQYDATSSLEYQVNVLTDLAALP